MRALDNGDWKARESVVDDDERVFEFFLNQLRLKQGVNVGDFSQRTGLPWATVETRVQQAVEKGFLIRRGKWLQPTTFGWRFVNDIQQMFLP